MNKTLQLELPEPVYKQLNQQPQRIREAAIQYAIEAIRHYLEQEADTVNGRELLRLLPKQAGQIEDSPPSDLSANLDQYLYGDN